MELQMRARRASAHRSPDLVVVDEMHNATPAWPTPATVETLPDAAAKRARLRGGQGGARGRRRPTPAEAAEAERESYRMMLDCLDEVLANPRLQDLLDLDRVA